MTKKGKKAQKVAIVDGVVAAAQANPAIPADLSAADSAPALRNAIRKVLGRTCETNLLDNSMNLKDVAVALSQQLGNDAFTARVISVYGEKAVQAATNQGREKAVPKTPPDSEARGVKRALPTWYSQRQKFEFIPEAKPQKMVKAVLWEVLDLRIMQAISRTFATVGIGDKGKRVCVCVCRRQPGH